MEQTFFAPLKLNFYLHVTGKRPDGYHLLDSIFWFSKNIGDIVSVSSSDKFSLEIAGPFAEKLKDTPPEENILFKTAQIAGEAAERAPNIAVRLEKNIPLGAGLGGGSADAAALFQALCQLWNWHPDKQEKQQLLLKLGADVPPCDLGTLCHVAGIGEKMTGITASFTHQYYVLFVYPDVTSNTRQVFQSLNMPTYSQAYDLELFFEKPDKNYGLDEGRFAKLFEATRNDLTDSAIIHRPEIADALALLDKTDNPLVTRMTGSGSTCFAFYKSESEIEKALAYVRQHAPENWWITSDVLFGTASG